MYYIGTLEDNKLWNDLYNLLDLNIKSPFFSPAYYECYQQLNEGRTECFIMFKDEDNFLFYPYNIKSINSLGYQLEDDFFDVSGAYGYNGPIGKVTENELIDEYNEKLKKHFLDNNIVSELVKYCPIINNKEFHKYTKQIHVLDNVYIDLSQGLDQVWNISFSYSVRKAVRKGISYQLKTFFYMYDDISEDVMKIFYNIYISTMNRNKAEQFYFFNNQFFSSLLHHMRDKMLIVITYMDNIPISTELLLIDGKLAFGFLGGTLKEYYYSKANTYQRYELIKFLIDKGIRTYSMGGGAKKNDSIYFYKSAFSQNCTNPFYIGTAIHSILIYNELKDMYISNTGSDFDINRLQFYRDISKKLRN